jgi:hypothetical protein
VTYDEQEQWLRMKRGHVEVICNLGEADRTFEVACGAGVLLASRDTRPTGKDAIVLSPNSVAVVAAPSPSEMPDRFS